VGFPRYFDVCGLAVNSYRVFLILGICAGSLTAAALAQSSGRSPLRVGLAAMTCALCGLVGARVYYVLVHASQYLRAGSHRPLWDAERGGWSVFGALITFVPAAFAVARLTSLSVLELFDFMSGGVLAGGPLIRLGCVFNGCCAGRPTDAWFGVRLHDVRGRRETRIPVQFVEIGWWLIGGVLFLAVWPAPFAPGSYALAVLAWYGTGRSLLEPMRDAPATVLGRLRVDQLVALVLALAAAVTLIAWS
jgi:prolipoprotein diacylglyceryltransferase